MKHQSCEAPFLLPSRPPYCPNPACRWHLPEIARKEARFRRNGSRGVGRFPYVTRRFECARCGKHFSDSIFHLFYRDRTEPSYEQIFHYHGRCESRRELSRDLGCSISTVQRRFRKLAAQGLLIQAQKTAALRVEEPVAYDGIENFAFSQYDPNHINHAVGKDSLFLYDFNFAPLNRKGRRTPAQRKREAKLDRRHGRYPSDAIQRATERIVQRLLDRAGSRLELHTDDHHAYQKALKNVESADRIRHSITSSRKARNGQNPLFPINHCDGLARHHLQTFKRETIAFAKHSIGMVESFTLLMVWKNFLRPLFVKRRKNNPRDNTDSPAMRLGLEEKILSFREFYRIRVMKTQVSLSDDWLNFLERRDPYSRRKIAG